MGSFGASLHRVFTRFFRDSAAAEHFPQFSSIFFNFLGFEVTTKTR